MTASSVEFFPCRVQLMGLPRSSATSSSSAATAANIINHNATANLQTALRRRPPVSRVQGVSRNLFGAPDPGEINQLYQEESKRQRSYVLQRYNFDIKTSKPTDEQKTQQPTTDSFNNSTSTTFQMPTLIEQELKQHEQRLQKEKCNLNRSSSETTPSNNKILNGAFSGSKVMRRCCQDVSPTLLQQSVEYQKPYARQTQLTESFNIRKNKTNLTSNCNPANAEMITMKSRLNSHRHLDVQQLPGAMQAHEESCSLIKVQEYDEISTQNDKRKCVLDNNSSSSNCINCTELSLKFVVSSQNVSTTTTSSASDAHTQNA